MATVSQANRPLVIHSPLGKDDLLLVGFNGQEGISQLFSFQLDLLAANKKEITFDKVLGQKVTVEVALPKQKKRYFNGICNRVSQGECDATFSSYRLEIVPQFWLLTRRAQSRIFQHLSVPDILKKVLEGLDPTFEIQGTFHPRDFRAEYRESDFAFASRLMEEEGICYFFKHSADGHKMVVANTPPSHPDMPEQSKVIYEDIRGGLRDDDRVVDWEKTQELRSGKYTLWDHCFELPHKHLEAERPILDSVTAGGATHKLKVGGNDQLEIYDYAGGYAQRFDGVDKGGGDRAADIQKIFEDNKRTVEIRMQQEAMPGLVIRGSGTCRHLVSGHKFTVETLERSREKGLKIDGQYLLTSIIHAAHCSSGYTSGGGGSDYRNTFTCIPAAMPFRPVRQAPRPVVQGTQTAVVVGPAGEEIFTDKYGRVKVQFHWDRQGKNNADSSCWVRVGTPWAGKKWGMIHIPRIGQEVIVDFLEGDPDQPIIVGSVYNADMMPPYALPDNKTQSGLKTRSTLKGGEDNFNELRFEDKKGSEDVYFHAEKDFHRVVEHDDDLKVGNDQTIEIKKNRTEKVKEGNEKVTVEKGNRDIVIETGNNAMLIKMGNQTTKLDLGKSETEAMQSIELKVGQSSIKLDQMGVTIKGMMISVEGQIQTQVKGLMTQVNGDAMLTVKGGITMIN